MKVSTLLNGSTCGKHQLKATIEYNFIAVREPRKNRNPATII